MSSCYGDMKKDLFNVVLEYYCFELNNEVFEEDHRKSNIECGNKETIAQREMNDNDDEILKQYLNVMQVDEPSADKGNTVNYPN